MSRFLIVDDEPLVARVLARLLHEDGHSVAPFTVAEEALLALARETFDAVITDVHMPGAGGHAVVKAARTCQPLACVVVASGRGSDPATSPALLEAGACFIVDKPLDYDSLASKVAECRARGGPQTPGQCPMRQRSLC